MVGRGARMLLVATLAVAALATPAAARDLARTTADVRIQGPAIPRSFLGFSQDLTVALAETGTLETGVNPILVQFYRNLSRHGGGTPILRLGGTDADGAWWNPKLKPSPFGLPYSFTPGYFEAISRFLTEVGGRIILGVNFAINRADVPADVIRAAQSIFGEDQVLSYEVGNEPHVYPERPLGTNPDGSVVYTRGRDYDRADYLREIAPILRALSAIRPRPPLSAPGFCCDPWLFALPKLLRSHGRKLAFVGLHRYPLLGPKDADDFVPTPLVLLQNDVFIGNLIPLERAVRQARRRGLDVRITETNSVTSGGVAGTSDRFAAALWGSDWLFGLAAIGVKSANLHGISANYQPFRTAFVGDRFLGEVKPLYFGMLLFAEAAGHRGRLLPTSYLGVKQRAGANVKVWGTVDKVDRAVRVAIINKGHIGGPVRVRIPFAAARATVGRLRAPSLDSNSGVTWAGQGFALPTTTGRLVGDRVVERVRRRGAQTFVVRVPAFSAALLTVKVRRTRAEKTS